MIGGPDLKRRTLSALIMIPVVLGVTLFGGAPFALVWGIAAAFILYEWTQVARLARPAAYLAAGLVAICGAGAALYFGHKAIAGAILLAAAGLGMALTRTRRAGGLGILVAAAACLPMILLRADVAVGLTAVLFIYAIVWCTDIGAYFVGRAVGGPKLAPRLSPNKTWAGAIGGAVCGTLAGALVVLAMGVPLSLAVVPLGLALSIAGQLGDLAESAFKRAFGVKDAGNIIPGHGGVLDRLDGFMAAATLALAIGMLRHPDLPAAGLLLW